jgi:stage V sporulation protein K
MVCSWPHPVLTAVERGALSPADALLALQETNLRPNNSPPVETVLRELDSLIGLVEVKKLMREIYAFAQIQKRRRQECLTADSLALHMVFKGNPGTGKTTVARMLGNMFQAMDILPRGQVIEVERADLVGEYIGHTAQKMREQLAKAYGGILFIDEAYSLARGGERDFGKEAIDCMVKPSQQIPPNLTETAGGPTGLACCFCVVSYPAFRP